MGARQTFTAMVDPSKGMELRNALTWYGDQDMAGRYIGWSCLSRVPQGKEGALTPAQWNELVSFRVALIEDLLDKLRSGELIARGFRTGDVVQTELPPAWWCGCHPAQIDLKENSAEALGSRFIGILVYPPAPQDMCGGNANAANARPKSRTSRAELTRAYHSEFPDRNPTKRQAEDWARANGYGIGEVREIHKRRNGGVMGRPRKNAV